MLCSDILQLWQLKWGMTCLNKEKNRFSNFYTVFWMIEFLKWFLSLFKHSNLSTWLMFFGQMIFSIRIYSFHRFYATWTNFWCTNMISGDHQSGSALLSINDICTYKINSADMKAHFHVRFIQITFPQPPTSSNWLVFYKLETYKDQEHRILCKVFS